MADNVTYPDNRYSTEGNFDLQKDRASLDRLKKQSSFPPLFPDGKVYSSNNKLSDSALQSEVRSKFEEIQISVFGRPDVLKLAACDGCEPNIEVGTLTVYIDPAWIMSVLSDSRYKTPMTVIQFALAHEISHYVYESEIANSSHHASPNGQQSYFFVRLHNEEFVRSLFAKPDGLEKANLLREVILEETSRHAEIDSIAKVLLDDLGVKNQCDVVMWLRSWTTVPEDLEKTVGGAAFSRINSFKNLIGSSCP
jgi:hypothetical protein